MKKPPVVSSQIVITIQRAISPTALEILAATLAETCAECGIKVRVETKGSK